MMKSSYLKTACGVAALAVICLPLTRAHEQTAASRIVSAAKTFLATLDEKQRQTVLFSFDDQEQRKRWSNFPVQMVPRGGISLPSLIMLSRTSAYTAFRLGGSLFAGLASLGWIIERLFGVPYFVDGFVDRIAQRGVWIGIALLVISIVLWLPNHAQSNQGTFGEQPSHATLEGI